MSSITFTKYLLNVANIYKYTKKKEIKKMKKFQFEFI